MPTVDRSLVSAVPVVRPLFAMSTGVFFLGGFLTAIVSLLVPRFKLLYHLDYTDALLVQVASHSSYLLFALPITLVIVRIGYMRAIAAGTAIMAVACLGIASTGAGNGFVVVLAALLLLSLGITFLQIGANTVVTIVGAAHESSARLTLLQGFNSLGTVLGPVLTAGLLLETADGGATISLPFVLSAIALAGLSFVFFRKRDLLPRTVPAAGPALARLPALLRDRRLVAGTAAMFAYVGAEVTIGTLLTNYLIRADTLAATPIAAGRMVSLYWGGAMVGRFLGAVALRRVPPPRLLAATAVAAVALVVAAVGAGGAGGAVALLAVGLCNAIMYPTIYALALPVEPAAAPLGSMLLCMAVAGGAVVPFVTGITADSMGLRAALGLPGLCYAGIAWFAASCTEERR